jgi:hypothetical protein
VIITITDHFEDALEAVTATGAASTSLMLQVATDQCEQPSSVIVVTRETMNEILVELAAKGHVAVTQGVA